MANEFIARKGLIALSDSQITGSLDVTGSLSITGISDVSASIAAAGGGSDFPYTGSAIISGSLEVIGKVTGSVLIEGSGSTLFEVVGSEGQLFSITDSLSGSLFAVSDVSGLPILEVFSDDTVKIGSFNNEAITVSGSHTTIGGTLAIPGFINVSASLAAAVAGGDNLGNHTSSLDLNMGGNAITNVGNVDGVDVSALNSTVSTNTSNIATLTAATSSYLTTVDISDDTNLTAGTGITLTGDTLSTNDSQIVHDNLSGFVANEHIDHSTVSITAGNGLTGGGTIAATRTIDVGAGDGISVAANSVAVDGTVLRTTGKNVISSSAQIATEISGAFTAGSGISLSSGEFSVGAGTGLTQGATGLSFDADGGTLTTNNADVDHILINDGGVFKRITKGNINVGDFNNNVGYLTSVPAGTISSSAQVDHDATTNFNANEHFTQANITTVGTVTSGDVSAILPTGTVSGSSQINLGSATGTVDISSQTNLAGGTNLTLSGDTINLDANISLTDITASGNVDIDGTLSLGGFTDVSASLAAAVAGGDNLGNHTASLDLNMGGNAITNVGNVDGVDVSALNSTVSTNTSNISSIASFTASLDPDITTLSLPASTTISTFGASLIANTTATDARSTLGLGTIATTAIGDYVNINGDILEGDLDFDSSNNYNIINVGEVRANTISGSTLVSDGVTVVSTPDAQTLKIGQSAGGSGPMKVSIVSNNTQYGLFSNTGIELTGSVDISSTLSIPGFADVSASLATAGTVDTTGTPANNQIARFTDSNTLKGDNDFTFDGGDMVIDALNSIVLNTNNNDAYFQIKGSSDDNLLQVNRQLDDKVGIGTSTPSQKLTVAGNISASGDLSIQGFTSVSASLAAASGGGGGGAAFPFTGSAEISGSLEIVGSGSNVFNIEGSLGQLFSVSDSFSGSLFKVATISGIPVLEAFSDNTVKIGTFNNEGLIVGGTNVTASGDVNVQGTLSLSNGQATTPSLAFKNDTNTGIYSIAPDTMGLVAGGSSKINVGSTVGVFTPFSVTDNTDNTNTTLVTINNTNTGAAISTNQYSLKVNGGAAYGSPGGQNKSYGGYFTAGNTNATNPDSIALYAQGHEDGAPNSYAAIFSGSAGGVVGINTMEPTVELDVVGSISASGDLSIQGFPSVSASLAAASSGGGGKSTSYTGYLELKTNSQTVLMAGPSNGIYSADYSSGNDTTISYNHGGTIPTPGVTTDSEYPYYLRGSMVDLHHDVSELSFNARMRDQGQQAGGDGIFISLWYNSSGAADTFTQATYTCIATGSTTFPGSSLNIINVKISATATGLSLVEGGSLYYGFGWIDAPPANPDIFVNWSLNLYE